MSGDHDPIKLQRYCKKKCGVVLGTGIGDGQEAELHHTLEDHRHLALLGRQRLGIGGHHAIADAGHNGGGDLLKPLPLRVAPFQLLSADNASAVTTLNGLPSAVTLGCRRLTLRSRRLQQFRERAIHRRRVAQALLRNQFGCGDEGTWRPQGLPIAAAAEPGQVPHPNCGVWRWSHTQRFFFTSRAWTDARYLRRTQLKGKLGL
jgi:hypothetical protein